MRRNTVYKSVVAWMFLAAFSFVFLVKDFHSHEGCNHAHHHHEATDKGEKHAGSCLICHFFFSPFALSDNTVHFAEEDYSSYFIDLPAGEVPNLFLYSFHLRAPPASAC